VVEQNLLFFLRFTKNKTVFNFIFRSGANMATRWMTEKSWCDSFFFLPEFYTAFGSFVPGVLWVSDQVENEWSFTSTFPMSRDV
jgi:hypothetical protein